MERLSALHRTLQRRSPSSVLVGSITSSALTVISVTINFVTVVASSG
jgi:hypothetical protein